MTEVQELSGRATNLRVLHVVTVAQTLVLLRGQTRFLRTHEVDLIAVSAKGPYQSVFEESENVKVFTVRMSRRVSIAQDISAVAQLVSLIRRLQPHIVHSSTPKAGLLGMIAALIARTPVRVYQIRGLPLETLTGVARLLMTFTEVAACGFAHRVFCVSHSLRKRVMELGLCSAEKLATIGSGSSNGVDATTRFVPGDDDQFVRQEFRTQHAIPEDAVVVAFVGRLARSKGILELLEAWNVVRSQNRNAYLVVVGPVDDRDPIGKGVIARFASDPQVRLTGILEDTRPVFASSDLLVHPSHREGFPNVVLEAAAMSLPVVTTNATGCIDAVIDGSTGALVPVGDYIALSEAINKYIKSPSLRSEHGRRARMRVLEEFAPERIWQELLAEYQRLVVQKLGSRVSMKRWANATNDSNRPVVGVAGDSHGS